MSAPDQANFALLDDFNRADEGPPPSSNWSDKVLSTDSNGLKVTSNECGPGGAPTVPASSYWNVAKFADCQPYVTATVAPGGSWQIRVFARLQNPGVVSATNGYYAAQSDAGGNQVFRLDNSVATQIGPTHTGVAMVAGDKLSLECLGPKIGMYKYQGGVWQQTVAVTDSTYQDAGYVGLRLSVATTLRVDDFSLATVFGVYPLPSFAQIRYSG